MGDFLDMSKPKFTIGEKFQTFFLFFCENAHIKTNFFHRLSKYCGGEITLKQLKNAYYRRLPRPSMSFVDKMKEVR